jgi:cytochrome c553
MKGGARVNVAMNPILKGLSPEDMKDVAAYVTLLPWSKEKYLAAQAAAAKK